MTLTVWVKTLTGKTITLDIDEDSTLGYVQSLVQDKDSIEATGQCLSIQAKPSSSALPLLSDKPNKGSLDQKARNIESSLRNLIESEEQRKTKLETFAASTDQLLLRIGDLITSEKESEIKLDKCHRLLLQEKQRELKEAESRCSIAEKRLSLESTVGTNLRTKLQVTQELKKTVQTRLTDSEAEVERLNKQIITLKTEHETQRLNLTNLLREAANTGHKPETHVSSSILTEAPKPKFSRRATETSNSSESLTKASLTRRNSVNYSDPLNKDDKEQKPHKLSRHLSMRFTRSPLAESDSAPSTVPLPMKSILKKEESGNRLEKRLSFADTVPVKMRTFHEMIKISVLQGLSKIPFGESFKTEILELSSHFHQGAICSKIELDMQASVKTLTVWFKLRTNNEKNNEPANMIEQRVVLMILDSDDLDYIKAWWQNSTFAAAAPTLEYVIFKPDPADISETKKKKTHSRKAKE